MTAEQIFRGLEQMRHDAGKIIGKTQLLEELKKIVSDKGFEISDNEGAGNCMFYALSEQLNLVKGIQISHEVLRHYIVQYLKENPTLVSYNVRHVAKVSIGVLVEPQILLSTGGVLTRGFRGHAPPEIFENLHVGSQNLISCILRPILGKSQLYRSFLSNIHHFNGIIVST